MFGSKDAERVETSKVATDPANVIGTYSHTNKIITVIEENKNQGGRMNMIPAFKEMVEDGRKLDW